ncbi:MAG TPA: PCRF domain-containing protein, partial [Thermoanaerobaculia bacterium]|nr:PCRF domain-containing protein [Thermoanaerobaculia bacterium]
MLEKLDEIERRYASLEERLGSPDVASDHQESTKIHRAMREIAPVVGKVREMRKAQADLAGALEMLETLPAGDELREMAQGEADGLKQAVAGLEEEIRILLLPKDPNDGKNVVLEIRAGTGG